MRTAPTLTTARLVLGRLVVDDVDDLHAVLDDAALHRFTGGEPATAAELLDRVTRWQAGGPADGSQVWLNWLARRRSDAVAVGHLQATVEGETAALAWVVATRWQGRGYASEAAAAVADALRAAGATRLTAHIHPDHVASQHVAAACGLHLTPETDPAGESLWSS